MKKWISNKENILAITICLCISIILWLTTNFSHHYEKQIPIKVVYTNLPTDKILENEVSYIYTTIRTTGWVLLFNDFKNNYIDIDWSDFNKENLYFIENTETLIAPLLPSNTNIVKTQPLQLNLKATELANKNIPLLIDYQVKDMPDNYFVVYPPSLSHDKITIYGSENDLQTIDKIQGDVITINDINTNKVKIELPDIDGIIYDTVQRFATFTIEEYTEKTLEIDIETINVPQGLDFTIYPEKIDLKFLSPFSMYEKISAKDFLIQADFNNIDVPNDKRLDLKIVKQPTEVKNVSLLPESIEFIIYQN